MVCPAVSPAEFREFIVQAFVGASDSGGGVGLLEPGQQGTKLNRGEGTLDAPSKAPVPEGDPSGGRCWPYDSQWSLRDECLAELLAEDVFDDEDDDFDDDFDEDFEEDWEDDLPQDEEFPDTFGGADDDDDDDKKSPFQDDPDFDE